MEIGDRIKVIDQEIYGKIVWIHSNEVVIEDEDAETEDNTLAFKKSEVEEITGETKWKIQVKSKVLKFIQTILMTKKKY